MDFYKDCCLHLSTREHGSCNYDVTINGCEILSIILLHENIEVRYNAVRLTYRARNYQTLIFS